MTRVFGYARDPESGAPLAGCEVNASIFPRGAAVLPIEGGSDRYVTGADGRWELSLAPTAGTGATMKIREWLNRSFYIDIPAPAEGDPPINVTELIVDPGTGEPPAGGETLYVTRAELGEIDGVATLGFDGKLTFAQRPAGSGGGGTEDPVVDWFSGHGPPSGTIAGAALGDMYVNLDNGLLYQLL